MATKTGPIATFGAITGGMTYVPGTYPNVPLTGGNGSGATADLTVGGGGAVTGAVLHNFSASAQVDRTGKNYQVADVLSAAAAFDGVGAGSGFSVPVATLAAACENCFYGKIIPVDGGAIAGKRYCGSDAYLNSFRGDSAGIPQWADLVTPDNYWCGDGIDINALTSFSSGAVALPSTAFQGQTGTAFSTNGANSYVVTYNGNLSKFWLFPVNSTSAAFLRAHGIHYSVGFGANLGQFQIFSTDGTNFTGAEGFVWLGMP